jgi:hypothetical protein
LVHCEVEVLFGFVALESVLGCEGKIISEVLVSGFEGEKRNLRVLCCVGCGGKAENCVIEEEEEEEEE